MDRFLLVVLILIATPVFAANNPPESTSLGQKRVALVVGNSTYQQADLLLKNPANDAKSVATSLRSLNIEVIEAIDLDYRGMREALRRFDRALQDADAGLFYYAGHAMEYQGQNYLFPTDAILETEGDVGLGLVDLDQVLRMMETAVPTRLMFLDSCRNNPMARSFRSTLGPTRSAAIGRGLGRVDATVGTFIAYATAPGDVAADGMGKNSPFTTAILKHLNEPGLEISQMMHKVRNSVIETTKERQVPWESSSLRGPFILNLNVTINPAPVETPATPPVVELPSGSSVNEGYAKAVKLYHQGCEGGDTNDCVNLGYQYDMGRGVEQDYAKSLELYQQGCDAGHTLGCNNLGVQYEEGQAVEQDYAKALELYQQACNGGYALGCKNVGDLYDQGSGIEQNYAKANEFYRQGCDGGRASSCTSLGYQYDLGRGVEQDYAKSLELYQQGCDAGHARGCTNLGIQYRNGRGIKQDEIKAVELYKQGCGGGNALGCKNLGYLYREGIGVERNYAKAKEFYRQACDGGNVDGCEALGKLLNN